MARLISDIKLTNSFRIIEFSACDQQQRDSCVRSSTSTSLTSAPNSCIRTMASQVWHASWLRRPRVSFVTRENSLSGPALDSFTIAQSRSTVPNCGYCWCPWRNFAVRFRSSDWLWRKASMRRTSNARAATRWVSRDSMTLHEKREALREWEKKESDEECA